MPWPRGAAVAQRRALALAAAALRPSDAFAPFDRDTILAQSSMCERWPTASAPPSATAPAAPVPTLLLEGADDVRTPIESARRVTAGSPASRLVVAPGGHDVSSAGSAACDWPGASSPAAAPAAAPRLSGASRAAGSRSAGSAAPG